MMRTTVTILSATVLALGSACAAAQGAARPLRLVVPFPAGGASDAAARIVGQAYGAATGQAIVVDNRPGAGGSIAAQAVLAAPADGNTLLWGVASMTALPLLMKQPPFQSFSEMAPVSMVGRFTYVLSVHAGVPARTVGDLVRHARSNPGKVTYATGTLGEYMTTAQFAKATGTDLVRVPYKGGAQAMPDLLAGRVQLYFTPVQASLPHAKDGRLRLLATVLPQRSPAAPDVPTLAEAGVAGVSTPTWQALLAPPGTPSGVTTRLAGTLTTIVRDAEVRARFEQQALVVEAAGPDALARTIAEDFVSWRNFVRDNDVPQE